MSDRNFDGIAQRFQRNIYGNPKGELRLATCRRELQEQLPQALCARPMRVWDAGGGIGQMAAVFLADGHHVYLNDLSAEMLALARQQLQDYVAGDRLSLEHCAIQQVPVAGQFQLVLCHAVLEWVVDMEAVLASLVAGMAPGGYLSLMFYNLNALVLGNMIKGNLYKLRDEDFAGHPGGLTPPAPRQPQEVEAALHALGLEVVARRGVRLSHDLMSRQLRAERSVEDMLAIDWQYGAREPFWALGRYVHLLCRRRSDASN
ncbi:methyltransferase domain-containing protein [Spongiibacter sp.]|uniref:methyltransferase domain-containing protein n=1 Tax=Spongiibacter sp. TaxID=2024860 RepID=UPI00356949FC